MCWGDWRAIVGWMKLEWTDGRGGMGVGKVEVGGVGGKRFVCLFVSFFHCFFWGGRRGQTWLVSEVGWGVWKLMMIVEGAWRGGRDSSARFPWGSRLLRNEEYIYTKGERENKYILVVLN